MALAGSVAGSKDKRRIRVYVDDKPYSAPNLIWKLVTGSDPAHVIDHKNRNPHDNRWRNLREADANESSANRRFVKPNRTGFRGVRTHRRKFIAKCGRQYLGMYSTAEEAHAAYLAAAKQRYGPFLNL
jgi:hypothetical protein